MRWIGEFQQALTKMKRGAAGAHVDWTALPPEARLVVKPEHRRGRYPVIMDLRQIEYGP